LKTNKEKNTINIDSGKILKKEINLENGIADNSIPLNSDINLNLDESKISINQNFLSIEE
jgi:hypothetical protein